MNAFVTGSTGFLGNHLVRLLVEQRHTVKVLARSTEKARQLFSGMDVTIVTGDMLDVEPFAVELEGCDLLFHIAVYSRNSHRLSHHWKMLEAVNIKGTLRLLLEAEQRGVKKAIYVSAAAITGMKPGKVAGDETTPPHPIAMRNLYFKSKVLAEEAITRFLREQALPVVLILPGWMFGPRDMAPTPSGQLVLDYLARKIPGIIDGGACVVDVRDVAQAMILAVELGKSGERYIVGGPYASMEEILKTLEKVTGIPAPRLHIPYAVALTYAAVAEIYGTISGQPILVSRAGVQLLHAKIKHCSDKAVRELEIRFRPLEETLRDEVNWYHSVM
ncbi:SDR family oxidoreductase [Candidatus Poribacteria bacterium]|nr:SDR family oxidoreductase [Candidatus Poribacteria bacterium]